VATNEWKEVGENQAIPRGLHIRLNLQTGKKEAKLLDEDKASDKNLKILSQDLPIDSKNFKYEEFKRALKDIKSDESTQVSLQTVNKKVATSD
jgi:nucleotide exchange factor SIL1